MAAPSRPNAGHRPEAEDQDRVEHDVHEVGQPQRPHRQHRVAGAAEDAVDHEEQGHGDAPAEHDGGERPAVRGHLGGGAEQLQEVLTPRPPRRRPAPPTPRTRRRWPAPPRPTRARACPRRRAAPPSPPRPWRGRSRPRTRARAASPTGREWPPPRGRGGRRSRRRRPRTPTASPSRGPSGRPAAARRGRGCRWCSRGARNGRRRARRATGSRRAPASAGRRTGCWRATSGTPRRDTRDHENAAPTGGGTTSRVNGKRISYAAGRGRPTPPRLRGGRGIPTPVPVAPVPRSERTAALSRKSGGQPRRRGMDMKKRMRIGWIPFSQYSALGRCRAPPCARGRRRPPPPRPLPALRARGMTETDGGAGRRRAGQSCRISITDRGSTRAPLMRTVQCRWGPVTRPVAPERATTSPFSTRSPSSTRMRERWAR